MYKDIAMYLNHEFESSTVKTTEFKAFARKFRSEIKRQIKGIGTLSKFSAGHFYVSGFITASNGNVVYFSISDVRYFKNAWHNSILVRTAASTEDYTGGSNTYCKLPNFGNHYKIISTRTHYRF